MPIPAGQQYGSTQTWNDNGWTTGFFAAPRCRVRASSTTFSYRLRVDQRNNSDSSWITRRDYTGSNSRDWIQWRRTWANSRPRWRVRRTTGFGQGNPTIRINVYGGAHSSSVGRKIVWCNTTTGTPPTSDVNDRWQGSKGALITTGRQRNVTCVG